MHTGSGVHLSTNTCDVTARVLRGVFVSVVCVCVYLAPVKNWQFQTLLLLITAACRSERTCLYVLALTVCTESENRPSLAVES
jgi:hypothetical protein